MSPSLRVNKQPQSIPYGTLVLMLRGKDSNMKSSHQSAQPQMPKPQRVEAVSNCLKLRQDLRWRFL